jgi:hypothetical protein
VRDDRSHGVSVLVVGDEPYITGLIAVGFRLATVNAVGVRRSPMTSNARPASLNAGDGGTPWTGNGPETDFAADYLPLK